MRCRSCGHENGRGIVFCTQCGARLGSKGGASGRPTPAGAALEASESFGRAASPAPPAALVHVSATPGESLRPPSADHCPSCNSPGAAQHRFCPDCGLEMQSNPGSAEPGRCWRCGAAHDSEAVFCKLCGAPRDPGSAVPGRATTPDPAGDLGIEGARLVVLRRDGGEARRVELGRGPVDIGSGEGQVVLQGDPFMSARHARIERRAGTYVLCDLRSLNGVYRRLRRPHTLKDGDFILLGQQVLRFELLSGESATHGDTEQAGVTIFGTPSVGCYARLVQYGAGGGARDVHHLFREETVLGRENGDIVWTDDPFLSRRHAIVQTHTGGGPSGSATEHLLANGSVGRQAVLRDLGSSNGTSIRIRGEVALEDGDQFRLGRHLFRFEV